MKAPYLLVGFDVDPNDGQADAIIRDVQREFPFAAVLVPFGVANVWAIELSSSDMIRRFNQLSRYLVAKDAQHDNRLRWVVQLCRSAEVSLG